MRDLLILFSTLLFTLFLFSCEKDIFLDIPPGTEDPVVESWIYEDSGPLVMLSKQFSGYGTFNQADLAGGSNIQNALVFVSENNATPIQLFEQKIFDLPFDLLEQVMDAYKFPREFAGQIQLIGSFTLEQQLAFAENTQDSALITLLNSLNFYTDTSNTIVGQGGSAYQLRIETEGQVLTAETTIPIKIDINSLSYEFIEDNPDLALVTIDLSVQNFTEAFVLSSNSRNDSAFIVPDYFGGGLFDNSIFAGTDNLSFPLFRGYADNEDPEVSELGFFDRGDEITLKWQNIDEDTYNFWFSVFNDGGDTPFSAATLIKSNIQGGFGVWAGYNTSYSSITIQ